MKQEDTLVEFSVVPIGGNDSDSISPTIAKVARLVKNSPLASEIHAMGTLIEGPLDDCIDLVKSCLRETLQDNPRVSASMQIDVRPGHANRIQANVESVKRKIA